MEDFDILTMILSALQWQSKNHSIAMLTDDIGAEYFCSRSLSTLWNGGISTPLNTVPPEIDPFLFWAGGKIWALKSTPEPVAMIDTDLIVWENTDFIADFPVAVAHREDITPEVYPDESYFKTASGYSFPFSDWRALPCNTAFLYIRDTDFKNKYVTHSLEFMLSLKEADSVVIPMVFAEQRMLAMCASQENISIHSLLDKDNLNSQKLMTHVWGYKDVLRRDAQKRSAYCRRCINRIRRDFPEFYPKLYNIPELIHHMGF